jgi:replicative DNA helicase
MTTAKATRVWFTGHRPVYKLTLRSGRTIRATANHPFRTLDGWTALEDLTPGDRIGLPRGYPQLKPISGWSDSAVILLAHLIGDGCFAPRQPIHYTSASEANLDAVTRAAREEFNVSVRRVSQRTWSHLYLSAGANKWHPNPLRLWLDQLGIYGQRSYQKHIPEAVFSLPEEQISLFLRHLWATDGSIYLRKTTHGMTGTIYYSTSSEILARQVQDLLSQFGIPAQIKGVQKGQYRPNYHVHISGKDNQLHFAREIGAYGDRANALKTLEDYYRPIKSNPNLDTIPVEIWQHVKTHMHAQDISQRQMAALRGTSYGGDAHFGFAPTRSTLISYASILEAPDLRQVAEADIYWDTIQSVEAYGEEDVYDMTVPETHNFVANGILVHNSLEQDADIVMFIHRPDAMEKDSPKANLAEIIVAKHRNGPTHSGIELVFLNNLARFDNAAPAPGRR